MGNMCSTTFAVRDIMETFHNYASQFYFLCPEHGGRWERLAFSVGISCGICRKPLVMPPNGTIAVWENQKIQSTGSVDDSV